MTKERADELLSKQETQIEDTCEYCLTCQRCKKYLTYSKEYKKVGFWTFNKNVKIWEVFDPGWSYKNTIFEIRPCKLWFILNILFYNKKTIVLFHEIHLALVCRQPSLNAFATSMSAISVKVLSLNKILSLENVCEHQNWHLWPFSKKAFL